MKTSKYHHLRKKCVTHLANFIEWLQKSQYAKDTIRADINYTLTFFGMAARSAGQGNGGYLQ